MVSRDSAMVSCDSVDPDVHASSEAAARSCSWCQAKKFAQSYLENVALETLPAFVLEVICAAFLFPFHFFFVIFKVRGVC